MKLLFLIFAFGIFGNAMAVSVDLCTDVDKVKIEKCYNDHVFSIIPINQKIGFRDHFLTVIQNATILPQICESKKNLDQCLGQSTLQRCFNVEDFKNVTFVHTDSDARTFIATYLQTDYACAKVPTLFKDQQICIFYQGNQCTMNSHNCSTVNTFASCAIERVTKHCGKPAGCFVQKFTTLQSCYLHDTCAGCDALNVNKKTFDDLCHDDISSGIRYSANLVMIIAITVLSCFFYSY